ncbi:MAG: creatininase family protein [Planctomycetota bacterium]
MLAKYEDVCYELLRPAQVKARREECPIAYIVAGSLEWHGVQNPLGTDSLKAHAVCCEAALKHGGVVLPPFYLGLHLNPEGIGAAGWGPDGWQGYTLGHNTEEMFEAAATGVARALVAGGWKVLVGVTGHDVPVQRDALDRAIRAATEGTGVRGFAVMEGALHQPNNDIPLRMDHAGAWETSCMQYAYPDKVDLGELRSRGLSPDADMNIKGPEGIGGKNPLTHASADMGRKIIERMGDLIGEKAKALLVETK